jgi:hypothetical protein
MSTPQKHSPTRHYLQTTLDNRQLGTVDGSPAMPGGAAPNWAFGRFARLLQRRVIVIVVPVLCCFTAPAGGVTLDR